MSAAPPVARDGDGTSCGPIKATAKETFVNGLLIARLGDPIDCKEGGKAEIVEGAEETFAEFIPVARVGDATFCDVCGSGVVEQGSPDTFAN